MDQENLLQHPPNDPDGAAAGSVSFWFLVGCVVGGWILGFLVVQVTVAVAYLVAAPGVDAVRWFDGLGFGQKILLTVPFHGTLAASALVVAARWGDGIRNDLRLAARWPDLPGGLVLGVATQFGLVILYWPILTLWPDLDVGEVARSYTDQVTGPFDACVLLVAFGLLAPIAEELFFRGILLTTLERRLRPWMAVVVSSVAFGAIHFQPLQFLGQAFMGVVAAILVQRTGRLLPAIGLHIGFNLIALIVLLSNGG